MKGLISIDKAYVWILKNMPNYVKQIDCLTVSINNEDMANDFRKAMEKQNMKIDVEKVENWLQENFGDSSIIDCYGNLTNETEVTSSFDTMEELMESFHKTTEE